MVFNEDALEPGDVWQWKGEGLWPICRGLTPWSSETSAATGRRSWAMSICRPVSLTRRSPDQHHQAASATDWGQRTRLPRTDCGQWTAPRTAAAGGQQTGRRAGLDQSGWRAGAPGGDRVLGRTRLTKTFHTIDGSLSCIGTVGCGDLQCCYLGGLVLKFGTWGGLTDFSCYLLMHYIVVYAHPAYICIVWPWISVPRVNW